MGWCGVHGPGKRSHRKSESSGSSNLPVSRGSSPLDGTVLPVLSPWSLSPTPCDSSVAFFFFLNFIKSCLIWPSPINEHVSFANHPATSQGDYVSYPHVIEISLHTFRGFGSALLLLSLHTVGRDPSRILAGARGGLLGIAVVTAWQVSLEQMRTSAHATSQGAVSQLL